MRRIPAAFFLCLAIALTGAAPSRPAAPKPAVTPAPASTATASPAASPAATGAPTAAPADPSLPIVVVYPFGTSNEISAANGAKAANMFVQVMNNAGGIDAIGAPPSVKKNDYLTYARSVDADYYITGYMTPLGDGVSLVEQVVSTRNGLMAFGQTAQIDTFQDASAQAVSIHDGIVEAEQSMKKAYQQAQATATPTPMAGGNQANLTKGIADIAGLFHRKGKTQTKTAVLDKPDKGVLVAHVNGSLPANNLTSATSELYSALNGYYNAQMTNANGQNLAKQADAICGKDRNNTIATGTLSATSERHMLSVRTEWTFKLAVYTCWGAKLAEHTATAGSLKDAVSSAVTAYAQAHPQNS